METGVYFYKKTSAMPLSPRHLALRYEFRFSRQAFGTLILATLVAGCISTKANNLLFHSEVPADCMVVDTFLIFAISRSEAIHDLQNRSFKALTTAKVDEYLVDIDIPATGFVISDQEYQKYDKTLQERRRYEEENPGAIVDWWSTGYLVPEGMRSFAGVFIKCPDSNVAH